MSDINKCWNLPNYPPSNSFQICFAALPQHLASFQARPRAVHVMGYLPEERRLPGTPEPCPRINLVSTPGLDPCPVLPGCAAQRDANPVISSRFLCLRAEGSKFASLCSLRGTAPFRQWHRASKTPCQARREQDPGPSTQGRVGRAGQGRFPTASISPHLLSQAETAGRPAAPFGTLHFTSVTAI